ncbi:unnamed protein product [Closterium sp. Naga37s-1]|nr:unnamed protein product [Closterium sp. Naga37s-1]
MANNRTAISRFRGSFEDLVGSLPITEPLLSGRSPLDFFYGLPYRPSQPSLSPSPQTAIGSSLTGLPPSDRESDYIEDGAVPVPGRAPGVNPYIVLPGRGTRPGSRPGAAPTVSNQQARRTGPPQVPFPGNRAIPPGRRPHVQRSPSPFGSLASLHEKVPFLPDEEEGRESFESTPGLPEREPPSPPPSPPSEPSLPSQPPPPSQARVVSRAREDGTTSLKSSIFNLSNTMIGAGMMALPAAMNVLGVVTGSVALIFVALLTYGSVMAMVRCTVAAAGSPSSAEEPSRFQGSDMSNDAAGAAGTGRDGNFRELGRKANASNGGNFSSVGSRSFSMRDEEKLSYNHTVATALGSTGRLVLQVSIVVNNLGLMMVFLDIIGDVLVGSATGPGVLPLDQLHLSPDVARKSILAIVILLILPLCLQDRLGSMKVASKISVALAIAFVLLVLLLSGGKIAAGAATMPPLFATSGNALAVFSVINVVTNAFICHFNAPLHSSTFSPRPSVTPIYREIRDRSLPRMRMVVCCSVIITTLVYLSYPYILVVPFHSTIPPVTPIYRELRDRSLPRMRTVVRCSVIITTLVYLAVGIFGLVLFGPDVHTDVLYDFDTSLDVVPGMSPVIAAHAVALGQGVKVGYAVSRVLSLPLALFQLRLVVASLLSACLGRKGRGGRDEGRTMSSGKPEAVNGEAGFSSGQTKERTRVNSLEYIQVDGNEDGAEEVGEEEEEGEERNGEEMEGEEEDREGEEEDTEGGEEDTEGGEEEEEDEEARLEELRQAEEKATKRRRFWRQVRFVLLTVFLLVLAFCGAVLVPDIWIVFQFMGCTAAVIIGFVFPGLVALRAKGGTVSVSDTVVAWLLVLVGVAVGTIGIVVNVVVLLTSNGMH